MSDNKMPSTVAEIFDGMLDESLLGLFILLLVVLLSTGYVYLQQQQAPTAAGAAGNAAAGARGGGRGARLPPNAAQTPANAIVTTNLSERQLLLHRALPSRNGARSITLCVDTLVTQAGDVVAWRSDAVPTLLTDLTQIGDVYLLAKVGSESDSERMDALRAFITQQVPGALKPHKLLFCSTTIGKIAFVRQIEPQLHIDGALIHVAWLMRCIGLLTGVLLCPFQWSSKPRRSWPSTFPAWYRSRPSALRRLEPLRTTSWMPSRRTLRWWRPWSRPTVRSKQTNTRVTQWPCFMSLGIGSQCPRRPESWAAA